MKKSKPRLELLLFNEDTPVEEVQSQQTAETEEAQEPAQEPEIYLDIQYNKESKGLTKEEAKELAEMGMFYKEKGKERLSAYEKELESYKNSPELKFMNEFLEKNGYKSFSEYQQALNLQDIIKENPALTDEQAKLILKGRQAEEQKRLDEAKLISEQEANNKREYMLDNFLQKYPDVKIDDIPQEVIDMTNQGHDLSLAYELHQLRQGTDRSKIEQEILSKLQQNNQISSGSASKGSPSHESNVKNMTSNDFQKMVEAVKRGEIKEI